LGKLLFTDAPGFYKEIGLDSDDADYRKSTEQNDKPDLVSAHRQFLFEIGIRQNFDKISDIPDAGYVFTICLQSFTYFLQ